MNRIIQPTQLLAPNQPLMQPALLQTPPREKAPDKQQHNNGNLFHKRTLYGGHIFMPTGYIAKDIQWCALCM